MNIKVGEALVYNMAGRDGGVDLIQRSLQALRITMLLPS